MQRPITTTEYFNLIGAILRENGQMPDDILDYAVAAYVPAPILTWQFDIRNNLDYGGNEGIYLELAIEVSENEQRQKRWRLGTFKTLRESPEAMRTMAQFLADFIVEDRVYVNSHLDDFTWTGLDAYAVSENGDRVGDSYFCDNLEIAIKCKDKLLKDYDSVIVRDNVTRKETCYKKDRER